MYVVSVTVRVADGFAEQFVEATLDNARDTRQEAGNVRFDVCRAEDDPNEFLLYECYRERDDFKAHHLNAVQAVLPYSYFGPGFDSFVKLAHEKGFLIWANSSPVYGTIFSADEKNRG